jgi:hypothetical protein
MRPLGLVFSPWPVKARVTKISCGVGTMSNAAAQVAWSPWSCGCRKGQRPLLQNAQWNVYLTTQTIGFKPKSSLTL